MSTEKHFTFPSADRQTQIHAIRWEPEGRPVAVVQIVHGMQEFIDRYADFAYFLNEQGFLVVGHDHLGHGGSVTSPEKMGFFAERDGNKCVIADMRALHRMIREELQHGLFFGQAVSVHVRKAAGWRRDQWDGLPFVCGGGRGRGSLYDNRPCTRLDASQHFYDEHGHGQL